MICHFFSVRTTSWCLMGSLLLFREIPRRAGCWEHFVAKRRIWNLSEQTLTQSLFTLKWTWVNEYHFKYWLYYLSNLFYYDIVFFFSSIQLFNCCCMIMYKFIFFIQAYDWSIVVTWPCYKLCYKPYYTKNRKFIKHTILKIEFHNKKSLFFERLEPELKSL